MSLAEQLPRRSRGVTPADLAVPLLLGALMLVPLLGFGLDLSLSALFYTPGKGFTLWHDWLLEKVLHDWVKELTRAVVLLLALAALASLAMERLRPLRRLLWFVLLTALMAAAAVTAVKHTSLQTCPVGITLFGGMEPYFSLFDPVPAGVRSGQCWPGGHAASAFSFFPLVFAARQLGRPMLARGLFWLVMLFGLVLTMVQVARGAHFFSHQVWTALICWYVSLAAYRLFLSFPHAESSRSSHRSSVAPGSLQLLD